MENSRDSLHSLPQASWDQILHKRVRLVFDIERPEYAGPEIATQEETLKELDELMGQIKSASDQWVSQFQIHMKRMGKQMQGIIKAQQKELQNQLQNDTGSTIINMQIPKPATDLPDYVKLMADKNERFKRR